MKKHIDVKVSSIARFYLPEDVDLDEVIKMIEIDKNLNSVPFSEMELLEDFMWINPTGEDKEDPSIIVYEDNKEVFSI